MQMSPTSSWSCNYKIGRLGFEALWAEHPLGTRESYSFNSLKL